MRADYCFNNQTYTRTHTKNRDHVSSQHLILLCEGPVLFYGGVGGAEDYGGLEELWPSFLCRLCSVSNLL